MVGPRGNSSPYNKRVGNVGRVTKQPYGYPSMSPQQQTVVATAYQNQVQQQPPHNISSHAQPDAQAPFTGGKYGDDLEELGGSRDFIDVVSFRDTAMVRYIRYHEWMELILGTAVDTKQYVNGDKSTTDIEARAKSTYIDKVSHNNDGSIFEKAEETRKEKSAFFRKATDALKDEFGSLSTITLDDEKRTSTEKSIEKELRENYGIVVVENPRVKPIRSDMDIPEPLTKELAETKHSDAAAQSSEKPSNTVEVANDPIVTSAPVVSNDSSKTVEPSHQIEERLSGSVAENNPTSIATVNEPGNLNATSTSNILPLPKDTAVPLPNGIESSSNSLMENTNQVFSEAIPAKSDGENSIPSQPEKEPTSNGVLNEIPPATDTEMPDVPTNPQN